jgi:hypothetical protein
VPQRKSKEEFIIDSKKIHGNIYDYSLVNYINNRTKVKIVCPKHGDFFITPYNHLKGSICPVCSKTQNLDKNSFIKKSNEIHGKRYDYSLVNYKNNKTKVKIICKNHGEFLQRPNDHLMGQGCPDCKKIKLSRLKKMNIDDFIKKSIKIHGNKYDYSNVKYKGTESYVDIICKKHGVFKQRPHNHIQGQGCPVCKMSIGENRIMRFFERNNIDFIYQKSFDNCLSPKNNCLFFDFYLPDYNICVEYDGEQHFNVIDKFGGEQRYESQKIYDNIKNTYCKENQISLIRITYKDNVELLLTNKFN